VMLILVSLTAGPALVAALVWSWWGIPIGVASGVLAWWYLGRRAAVRLEERGPELLTLLGHGRSATEQAKKAAALDHLPRWRRTLANYCLGFGAIPLFPQAVVPAIFKLTNNTDTKSWFLALHLAPQWHWPVIIAMAALGLAMYTYGGLTYLNAKKKAR
jgi:ABC-2 type transport system permease protein